MNDIKKASIEEGLRHENTSGLGKNSVIPEGVEGWSWGAFLLNGIWSIGNKTWIGLLCFIPLVGLIMPIVLGFKGREWAWRNKKWESIEAFNRAQRKWSAWGLALLTIFILFTAINLQISFNQYQEYAIRSKNSNAHNLIFNDYIHRFSSSENEIDLSSLTTQNLNVVGDEKDELLISSYQSCGSGVCTYAVYKTYDDESEFCYLGEIDMSSKSEEVFSTSFIDNPSCNK